MMATIVTLIILGMVFQGALMVVDSVLDAVKINPVLKSIPILGANLQLIWAYLFVAISHHAGGESLLETLGFGSNLELLSLERFGVDVAIAIAIVAFIPVRDAIISFLRQGIGGMSRNGASE